MTKELEDRLRKLEGELHGLRQETGQQAEPVAAKKRSKSGRRKSRRTLWFWLAGVITLCVLAVGGTLLWHQAHQSKSPLASYAKQSGFPLYYPSALPHGYYLDDKSVHASPQLVSYGLRNTNGSLITITLQPSPPGFNASQIIGDTPIPTTAIPIGSFYDISSGDSTKCLVTTGNGTLIFFSANSKLRSEVTRSIAYSLSAVKH